ncbi:MAG: aminotransferase class V-fold PLP-dependent enzyme [Cyclobacteriaceae bacterium]|nr:aminotransferase class V-fold PLP-dependent enzyme [Cyclobacteriaceae bacterium]
MEALGVDLLTIAGHKIYAPKGIGALYIRHGVKVESLIHGASQEKGVSPGTENVIHIVGLGKAHEIALRDFTKNHQKMLSARDALLEGLRNKLGSQITVNADLQHCLPNTLSIAFENVEAHALSEAIGNDVFISTGSACHADAIEVSSVLKAMHIDHKVAAGTVRMSTGKYTSSEEIDWAVKIISSAVKKLSQFK